MKSQVIMVRHKGGKVGPAGKTLSKKTSSKPAKSKAGKNFKKSSMEKR